MSKEEYRSLIRWMLLAASVSLIFTMLTHPASREHSGPVWKSFTTQETPRPGQ